MTTLSDFSSLVLAVLYEATCCFHRRGSMKTNKEEKVSKESVLRTRAKSKRKILTPKAGASLEKAVKNVRQILKKKNAEARASSTGPTVKINNEKPKSKAFKPSIKKRSQNRGIVYIGHLPHGFYEEQMQDYFKQFGKVTRVRVARSKNTGKSRGYGYVEFFHADVAKIAAETMNNYLMCGRLLKTTYIPPQKQHPGFFAGGNWTESKYPKLKKREKVTRCRNNQQSAEEYENYVKKSLNRLSTLEHKLRDRGISLKFQVVDIPQI